MNTRIERIENDITFIIKNTCNTVGCKYCHEKYETGCTVIDLQNDLLEEMSNDQ